MNPEWTILVRDNTYTILGQLDDYQTFEMIHRWRDVGAWSLDINRDNIHAVTLTTPGSGIIVKCNDTVVFSGPVTVRKHEYANGRYRIKLSGVDDNCWLARRVVSPSPTESYPPYTVSEYDIRTGYGSTVMLAYANANLGSGAAVGRRKAYYQIGADPVAGATITGRGRWQNLLTFMQELAVSAGSNIGFRTLQSVDNLGLPVTEFQVYVGQDLSGTVKFSPELGNLAEFSYYSEWPEANYVYVGGQGEGIARNIVERSDPTMIATWERAEGEFIDRRDSDDDTELQQSGDEELERATEKGVMSITPIDIPQQTFMTHYQLGDKVTVEWEEGSVVDIIREIKISLTPDGQSITPSVGNVPPGQVWGWLRTFRRLRSDVINLKRR